MTNRRNKVKKEGKYLLLSMLVAMSNFPLNGENVAENFLDIPDDKIQKIRFVEDDAQNYMVSKIYELKHQKANDIVPFILGAIRRYAKNGTADRINFSAEKKQLVVVSCPEPLMPYLDDIVAKLDRPGAKGPDGSGIDGTGIVRSVYMPAWRSGEKMMEIMVKAGISSNATEGASQDAVVAYDPVANLIYWKDSLNKDKDLKKYLAWLDRPIPQCSIAINIYEVRESDLKDLGMDYLTWKNGPGLNLLDVGASYMEGAALDHALGPYGFFLFAPAFDFSFIRMLQQSGKAKIATSAALTVVNGHDATLKFVPEYQNLIKDDDYASSVETSGNSSLELQLASPVIALCGTPDKKTGLLGDTVEDYAQQTATCNFTYTLKSRNVVERDNQGNELYEDSLVSGGATVETGGERLLSHYVQQQEVEQIVGVPFFCEIPILKYFFGTTTRKRERVLFFVSVKADLIHPDTDIAAISGELIPVAELVNR